MGNSVFVLSVYCNSIYLQNQANLRFFLLNFSIRLIGKINTACESAQRSQLWLAVDS
jgi:hypothetical protein